MKNVGLQGGYEVFFRDCSSEVRKIISTIAALGLTWSAIRERVRRVFEMLFERNMIALGRQYQCLCDGHELFDMSGSNRVGRLSLSADPQGKERVDVEINIVVVCSGFF